MHKQLSITEREREYKYFYVWIEGICPRTGEKIASFNDDGIVYTTKITESLRFRWDQKNALIDKLNEIGIADWCIDNDNTYVPTKYTPCGVWKGK